jgi:UDP-glucose 4-epimerase
MKVLVTGGNGFIGRETAEFLSESGYEPVIFDRHGHGDPYFETILGDIRDSTAVTEAFAHVDGFIHLAGVLGTQETINNPRPAAETNVLGGLNVLEAAAQYRVPGVNIAVGNHWMNNTYSITKSSVERFVRMFNENRGTKINVVRALNAYGPRQSIAAPYGSSKVRKIMPSFICKSLLEEPIEIYGDGSQVMDMVHVGDVVAVLVDTLTATLDGKILGHALEAGTGRDTTVLEIANAVRDAVSAYDPSLRLPAVKHLEMRPGEPKNSVVLGDPDGTLGVIGWDSSDFLTLEEGLGSTVKYYGDIWKPRYLNTQ